jgi:hypothetical protein
MAVTTALEAAVGSLRGADHDIAQGNPMAAEHYIADAENGDFIDDPSEDALFTLVSGLNHDDNTFITINPADQSAGWYASISLLAAAYEVELADPDHHEHQITTTNDPNNATQHLAKWLTTHQHPR